jgi:hypothetical protein
MLRKTMVVIGVLALTPFSLEAQRPDHASERLEAARARAAQAGVPPELLESRIAEGRAKGVSEDRIAQAIERREAGLAMAQQAFVRAGRPPTTPELAAGADAAEAGANAQALVTVIQAARDENRPVALAVLAELVGQGLPLENALDRVTAALERRDDTLANLPQQAAAERARGAGAGGGPPAGVGGGRPEGVGSGAGPAGMGGGPPEGVGRAPSGPAAGPPAAVPGAGQGPGGAQGGPPATPPGRGR